MCTVGSGEVYSFFGMHNKMAIQPGDSILPYTSELLQYTTRDLSSERLDSKILLVALSIDHKITLIKITN